MESKHNLSMNVDKFPQSLLFQYTLRTRQKLIKCRLDMFLQIYLRLQLFKIRSNKPYKLFFNGKIELGHKCMNDFDLVLFKARDIWLTHQPRTPNCCLQLTLRAFFLLFTALYPLRFSFQRSPISNLEILT